ncbi:MAG: translation initiation factor IF-2 [Bradymonadia bacterium]
MGKRVFQVAKELGMDHRDLLKRCDQLKIDVKNYMSVLSSENESRLRKAIESERSPRKEEQLEGTGAGVVRRRRKKAPADSGGSSRSPVAPARPIRPERPAVPRRPERPSVASRPGRRTEAEARPGASARPEPQPVKAEPKAAEAPQAAAAEVTATAQAPVAPAVEATPKAPEAAAPKAPEAAPAEQAPAKAASEQAIAAQSEAKAEAAPAEAKPAAQAEGNAPAKPESGERSGPERRPARQGEPERRRPAGQGPTVRPGQANRPTGSAGGARVLGTIDLDTLKRRTQRPQRSTGRPGGRPGTGRPGTGRPGTGRPGTGRPGTGRPGGGGPARPFNPTNMPPPPPGASGKDDRRRRPGGHTTDRDDRGGPRNRNQGRKRQLTRDDLYGNGRGRMGRMGGKRRTSRSKGAKTILTTPAEHKRIVRIDETISVGELGKEMGVKANELLKKLIGMGMMVTINQQIDIETAELLATEYNYTVANVAFQEDNVLSVATDAAVLEEDPDAELRAPVVTIMGHVDHGKTTLLDRIRSASVAVGEAGGITQHIGAYKVPVSQGNVVFLDTPGHAAFTAMRARGAQVTDIVVLVVAADDGVMPQTVEAINHARAAEVPIVVAVNKMDKPGADPERIKQELTKYELVPEEWGGDVMFAPVSALNGNGVDELLESLALQSEVLELKANPKKPAFGHVIEGRLDKGRGPVATVLVEEGTLKQGDYLVAGSFYGRVRAMLDDHGQRIKEAGPSTPVEVLGLNGVPPAGEAFGLAKNERDAKKVVETRTVKAREAARKAAAPNPLDLFAAKAEEEKKESLNLIIKADVQGSLEAVRQAVEQMSNDEVEVKVIHHAVGVVSESDVTLAGASQAVIVGFNIGADTKAQRQADQAEVRISTYQVIYDLTDAVKEMMSGMLTPDLVESALGTAEVRAVFRIPKVGAIAGCFITDGKVLRNAFCRVMREGEQVHQGRISGLKRFKNDVREVGTGYECGIDLEDFNDVQEGDILDVYEVKEVRRELD